MTARAEILHRLQMRNVPQALLPDLAGPWSVYEDPTEQFMEVLEQVGGRAIALTSNVNLRDELMRQQIIGENDKLISTLPGAEIPKVTRPHEFAEYDVSIVTGSFGVAENGAVWLLDHGTEPHRSCLFLVEHLVLVIRRESIVNNMHEAYLRIGRWPDAGFGIFISGPSKTADIEQSLVIGAQGPRRHTVVVMD